NMTLELLESYPEIRADSFIGRTDMNRDEQKAGRTPHNVIGTPSRVKDLMQSGALDLQLADRVVIDEADLMIDLGFLEEIDQITRALGDGVRLLVFSATIPEALRIFLRKYIGEVETIIIDTPK